MTQTAIIKLLAQQVFYLFDTNHIGLLIPDQEKLLLSDSHSRMRSLLEQVFVAAKKQSLIAQKTGLWEFIEMIRSDFRDMFNHRVELLSAAKHADGFEYPHAQNRFLLKSSFIIIEPKSIITSPVQSTVNEPTENEDDAYSDVDDLYRKYEHLQSPKAT